MNISESEIPPTRIPVAKTLGIELSQVIIASYQADIVRRRIDETV
jgi:hypothetical protein